MNTTQVEVKCKGGGKWARLTQTSRFGWSRICTFCNQEVDVNQKGKSLSHTRVKEVRQ